MWLSTTDRPLPGRLLPKATPRYSLLFLLLDVQRLLPQADSLRAMLASVWVVQRLLPQAATHFLLARACRSALSAVLPQVRSMTLV
jgi:hypothetical protein